MSQKINEDVTSREVENLSILSICDDGFEESDQHSQHIESPHCRSEGGCWEKVPHWQMGTWQIFVQEGGEQKFDSKSRIHIIPQDLLAHYGCVNAVEFSEDGDLMTSGGDDKRVLCWEVDRSCGRTAYKPVVMSVGVNILQWSLIIIREVYKKQKLEFP